MRSSTHSRSVSELTFQEFWEIVKRRWLVILIWVLICAGIGFAVAFFQKPEFEARRRAQIEGRTQSDPGFSSLSGLDSLIAADRSQSVSTIIEVLQSAEVYVAALDYAGIPLPASAEDGPQINVDQIGITNVVQITTTAEDEANARALGEAIPVIYNERIKLELQESIDRAMSVVSGQITETEIELKDKRKELAELKVKNDISDARQQASMSSIQEDQAESLLAGARAEVKAARASLESFRKQLADTPPTRTIITKETNIEETLAEQRELDSLLADREELRTQFREEHPQIKALDKRIAAKRTRITNLQKDLTVERTTVNPDYEALKASIREAEARLRAAEASVSEYEALVLNRASEADGLVDLAPEIDSLEQDIELIRNTLNGYTATKDQLELLDNNLFTPVEDLGQLGRVEQTAPRWALLLVLGIAMGLFIGTLVAVMRDQGLDQINYPREAVGVAGTDILARVPLRSKNRDPLITNPQSARAFEAYRILRAGVLQQLSVPGDNAIVVTSTDPQEGKTVVAGNLAMALAMEGRRTLLVDGNLRSPKVHKLFRVENGQGLSDVLLSTIAMEAALLDTEVADLKLMTAGPELANATEALGSPEMRSLIERMKEQFDVVIFDSADTFGVADTLELTSAVRNVLFVVEMNRTNKTRMEQSMAFIRQSGGRPLGLVLNKDKSARERIS